MIQTQIPKQILDFHKSTLDNGFKAMTLLQDQTEKSFRSFFEQTGAWMPAEGRKALDQWVSMCKQGQQELKKMIDENFQRAEQFLTPQEQATTAQPQAKSTESKQKANAKADKTEKASKTAEEKKSAKSDQ